MSDLLSIWRSAFGTCVQNPSHAQYLKVSSLQADMKSWTNELTMVVVQSCAALGWSAASKWNPCTRLPKKGQEFLGIDVLAFPAPAEGAPRWPLSLAAFELENSPRDDRVAYSLWKVLCVRASLRVVFAYRPDWEQGRKLVTTVCDDVVGGWTAEEQSAIKGQVVMVVGSRGEGETFPWGYFKFWVLNRNTAKFEKV